MLTESDLLASVFNFDKEKRTVFIPANSVGSSPPISDFEATYKEVCVAGGKDTKSAAKHGRRSAAFSFMTTAQGFPLANTNSA